MVATLRREGHSKVGAWLGCIAVQDVLEELVAIIHTLVNVTTILHVLTQLIALRQSQHTKIIRGDISRLES